MIAVPDYMFTLVMGEESRTFAQVGKLFAPGSWGEQKTLCDHIAEKYSGTRICLVFIESHFQKEEPYKTDPMPVHFA